MCSPQDIERAVFDEAEYLEGEERSTFTFEQADEVAREVGCHPSAIIRGLKALGFTMLERTPARRVRTISSNSNDRWYGPGSCPTHGGSGVDPQGGLRWG